MKFEINNWVYEIQSKIKSRFGDRVLFVGL